MKKEIVTIKDIAAALGVSFTTVHKAIYHKKGISEKTRTRILTYIEENDFRLNRAASALKRRQIQLVYAGVEASDSSQYFYKYINQGVNDCHAELQAFNVQLNSYFTPEQNMEKQSSLMRQIFAQYGDNMDGLLLSSVSEHHLTDEIKLFTNRGIHVVTINSDAFNSTRDAFVGSNAVSAGRAAAELMCDLFMPKTGQLILLAGNRDQGNHRLNVNGFLSEMQQLAPGLDILELYEFFDLGKLSIRLERQLRAFDDIIGIYCNNARGTVVACETVRRMGLSGKLKIIGADVFADLSTYFDDCTLTATIYQNPHEQGYRGLKYLYYLVTEEEKVPERTELNVGIALRSNYPGYL